MSRSFFNPSYRYLCVTVFYEILRPPNRSTIKPHSHFGSSSSTCIRSLISVTPESSPRLHPNTGTTFHSLENSFGDMERLGIKRTEQTCTPYHCYRRNTLTTLLLYSYVPFRSCDTDRVSSVSPSHMIFPPYSHCKIELGILNKLFMKNPWTVHSTRGSRTRPLVGTRTSPYLTARRARYRTPYRQGTNPPDPTGERRP